MNHLKDIEDATREIRELQDEAVCAIGRDAERSVSERVEKVIVRANASCVSARQAMSLHGPYVHIRLIEAVRALHDAQKEYRDAIKAKAVRQVRIVNPTAPTDVEMDPHAMYRSAILGTEVAQVYLSAADKYHDVLALEKSIAELHRLFLDLSILVVHQGVLLNTIEHSVVSARDHIEAGNRELLRSLKSRKATRRRMCCCAIVLVIVMALILGPVLTTL